MQIKGRGQGCMAGYKVRVKCRGAEQVYILVVRVQLY